MNFRILPRAWPRRLKKFTKAEPTKPCSEMKSVNFRTLPPTPVPPAKQVGAVQSLLCPPRFQRPWLTAPSLN